MDVKLWILYCAVLLAGRGQSGLTIYECTDGNMNVAEDKDVSLTCGTSGSVLQWDVYNNTNHTVYSGFCNASGKCTDELNEFSLKRTRSLYENGYYTVLSIKGITRFSARRVLCDFRYRDTTPEECSLRIKAYTSYTDGSCNISVVDWWVTGNCKMDGMYASDNNYICSWTENSGYYYYHYNHNDMYQNFGGFGDTLYNYKSTGNSRMYTRGVCSFKQPMPVYESSYTFVMTASPGFGVYYNGTIDIAHPAGLKHDCPNQVLEGSIFSCICFTGKRGTPPARITWDGRATETLQLTDVRRRSQGAQFTCRLIWGPDGYLNETTFYTLSVAYGPLEVFVNKTLEASDNDSEIVRLTCEAFDVYPSATFAWNVSCHNQTDNIDTSTCVFNLTQTEDNLVVTCTAYNKDFANVSASYSYVKVIKGGIEAHSSALSGSVNGGLIGAVIAAVTGIIIVAVIVVCIIKWRKGTICKERGAFLFLHGARKLFQSNRVPSRPDPFAHKPKDQPPIQRHAAPSGDLYTIAGTTTTSGQVGEDYASVCKMVENEVYEPEGDVRLQASPAGHEMNRSGDKETPTVKPKPAKVAMTSSLSVSGTGYMNVTEVSTDSGLGVYHIVPWAVPSERTPAACDMSAPGNFKDEYNILMFDDGSVHDDLDDSYNHLQLT